MTPSDLANILCRHGIIQREAIEDPEGYDGCATINAIVLVNDEIKEMQDMALDAQSQRVVRGRLVRLHITDQGWKILRDNN